VVVKKRRGERLRRNVQINVLGPNPLPSAVHNLGSTEID
jgi:hypothetical protein